MKLLDLENVNCSLVSPISFFEWAICIMSHGTIVLQSIHSQIGL